MKNSDFSVLPSSRNEARKLGIDRFFTGRPCKHGHLAPRYISTTQCSECLLEHARTRGGWKARPPKDEFLGRVKAIVERRGGILLSKEYVSARTNVAVRCEHRHNFEITPDNLRHGRWCPTCKRVGHSARQVAKYRSIGWLRDFARKVHGGDCLATQPAGMQTRVPWKCSDAMHPPFSARIANVVHKGNWCPACDAERRRLHPPKHQIARDVVERVVSERGGEIVNIVGGEWHGKRTRLTIRCADGHEWPASVDNLTHAGSWCPYCRHKGERIVRAIFEATFGRPFPKCRPTWMLSGRGKTLELDGYNESLRLAFEYQGPHHDRDTCVQAHDALKREACKRRGIRLIEVQAVKRPFPTKNVLEVVRRAFQRHDVTDVPILPSVDVFARELRSLQQLAKQKGGALLSIAYAGSEPHEWSCGNPEHPSWMAEPWRVRKGAWCPSCAGNRPLGIDGLRAWGQTHGLELLDSTYRGTASLYTWRCTAGHVAPRRKSNIEQSLRKMLPACAECAAEMMHSAAARRGEAGEFAQSLRPVVDEIRTRGTTSLNGIAEELNRRRIPTSRGRTWYASTVKNMLSRLNGLAQ